MNRVGIKIISIHILLVLKQIFAASVQFICSGVYKWGDKRSGADFRCGICIIVNCHISLFANEASHPQAENSNHSHQKEIRNIRCGQLLGVFLNKENAYSHLRRFQVSCISLAEGKNWVAAVKTWWNITSEETQHVVMSVGSHMHHKI